MDQRVRDHRPLPSPRRFPDRAPPMFRFGNGEKGLLNDSYRPNEFSYRAQRTNGPTFPDSFRPGPPRDSRPLPVPRAPQGRQQPSRPSRRGRENHQDRRSNGAFRRGKPATADRPLLVTRRSSTPEQLFGMTTENENRFKLADGDSLEAGSGSDSSSKHQPQSKRAKALDENDDTVCENMPKWSNPDPYTVLPPVTESDRKKKDVVQLIRKARISSGKDSTAFKLANGADFISFNTETVSVGDFSDPSIDPELDRITTSGTKTHYFEVDARHHDLKSEDMKPLPNNYSLSSLTEGHCLTRFGADDTPLSESGQVLQDLTGHLPNATEPFSRKRKRDFSDGVGVVNEWRAICGLNATPWLTVDHSSTVRVGTRLHKEICDFYEFVKPQKFENNLRHELVSRVSHFLSRYYHNCEVQYFGSFAAGLYLPTADMDLVVLSDDFRKHRVPGLPTRNPQLKHFLYRFADQLQTNGIARKGSTVAIFKARVPIVKYVDKITGLRVDISFENDTGPTANRTYQRWKAEFPEMPVIVSLIKQFLMMRGLNEVHTGGLGGFSVTCLVVSLLQNLPQIQSKAMDSTQNLGEIFMNFLDFYGNKFNSTTTGIRLNPPKFFPKHLEERIAYKPNKPWSLSIIDPNQYNNDISSGSYNVRKIFQTFSEAFGTLQRHMSDVDNGVASRFCSLLGPLYRGNYISFERQRAHMDSLYMKAPLHLFSMQSNDISSYMQRIGVELRQYIHQIDSSLALLRLQHQQLVAISDSRKRQPQA